jgi:hypothetical protein
MDREDINQLLNKSKLMFKEELTLSHCAWARTFDLVVRWQMESHTFDQNIRS